MSLLGKFYASQYNMTTDFIFHLKLVKFVICDGTNRISTVVQFWRNILFTYFVNLKEQKATKNFLLICFSIDRRYHVLIKFFHTVHLNLVYMLNKLFKVSKKENTQIEVTFIVHF